ncbi:MAG: translation initiation factor [Muribaculaceae bacterium]|nr:translation initiation factor [Muribaculaceae bacterium]
MMQQDWREALGALLPDTPAADVPQDAEPAPGQETETARLDVVVERKGRGGKTATIVAGFTVSDEAVAEIASQLKRRLGTGGSARGGEILIQGDRADAVVKALTDMGMKARRI